MPGFQVDPAALRAAATRIDGGAARVEACTARLTSAGAGAGTNVGFATSTALQRLVSQLDTVLKRIADGQRKCATNLTATADRYQRSDETLDAEFRRMWPGI